MQLSLPFIDIIIFAIIAIFLVYRLKSILGQNSDGNKQDSKINIDKKNLIVSASYLLFPYARSIISNITMEGGFKPLVVQPIEFEKMSMK